MTKIIHTKGNLISASDTLFVVGPDIYNEFKLEIEENDVLDGKIQWCLLDKKKKEIVNRAHKECKDTYSYIFTKEMCGAYTYWLKASYRDATSKKEQTATINISASCDAIVTSVFLSSESIDPGKAVNICIYGNGLNDNLLSLEAYMEDDGELRMIDNFKIDCIEGTSTYYIRDSVTKHWKPKKKGSPAKIKLKLKDRNNNEYITYNSDVYIAEISLPGTQATTPKTPETPTNKTFAKVGSSDKYTPDKTNTLVEPEFELALTKEIIEEVLTVVDGKTKRETNIIKVTETTDTERIVDVCTEVMFVVHQKGDADKIAKEPLKWYVEVDDTTYPLEDLRQAKIIMNDCKLQGNSVYFRIPKEWGQKTVTLIAYFTGKSSRIEAPIKVRDHIAAAFYRINTKKYTDFEIRGIKEAEGTWHLLDFIPPFYHIQGMYRDGNKFYLSGSARVGSPAYTYVIEGIKGVAGTSACKHNKTLVYGKGAVAKYGHPGGIQTADKLLAVGFEKYDPLGLMVKDYSLVCLFNKEAGITAGETYDAYQKKNTNAKKDTYGEHTSARIIRDIDYLERFKYDVDMVYGEAGEEINPFYDKDKNKVDAGYLERYVFNKYNTDIPVAKLDSIYDKNGKEIIGTPAYMNDVASATGIVYLPDKKMYLVAVRGQNQSVHFYKVDDALKVDDNSTSTYKSKSICPRFDDLGEFQNLNLHIDDRGDIYLFGMGDEGDTKNTCRLYRITVDPNDITVEAVWINSLGRIATSERYTGVTGNKLIFDCPGKQTDPCFHWSSCVYIDLPKGEDNKPMKQNREAGFKGKFTVYTSGAQIVDETLVTKNYDYYRYEEYATEMFLGNEDADSWDDDSWEDFTNPQAEYNFRELSRLASKVEYKPVNPRILCRYFMEDQKETKTN